MARNLNERDYVLVFQSKERLTHQRLKQMFEGLKASWTDEKGTHLRFKEANHANKARAKIASLQRSRDDSGCRGSNNGDKYAHNRPDTAPQTDKTYRNIPSDRNTDRRANDSDAASTDDRASEMSFNESGSKSSSSKGKKHFVPHLQDAKDLIEYETLVLGNLPEKFTLEDVYDLVQESNPPYLTEIAETRIMKVRFCQVILEDRAQLQHLIKKLDGFVIRGKPLIAKASSSLLSLGYMWSN